MADTGQQVLEVGSRIQRCPSRLLTHTAFKAELDDQVPLFDAMSLVDLAHTLMMIETGVIPVHAGRDLLAALLQLAGRPDDFVPTPAKGDLYTNREAWLAEHAHATGWLGAGRARREATTTAFMITLREALLGLAHALTTAGNAIIERARQFRSALMPDFTYLRPAQPTTFGHYLLGFAYPMVRDLERIRALYGRVNRCPAGCGSTNGSRLPQDREQLARLLGFAGPLSHARDAMWQADLPIEAAATLTAVSINLDRLAEDLEIYSTEAFGLIELDDGHARASKIMPQKKNPFALTHVRGLANRLIGTLAATAAMGRTPSGQPDNRLPLYGMIPRAIEDTREAADLMGEVVHLMTFNEERGRDQLEIGFCLATDLADTLVQQTGLDCRQAHRLVGCLARERLDRGSLKGLTAGELSDAAEQVLGQRIEVSDETLRQALDGETAVAARSAMGGAAPANLEAMASECDEMLAKAYDWVNNSRERLQQAESLLLKRARERARDRNA